MKPLLSFNTFYLISFLFLAAIPACKEESPDVNTSSEKAETIVTNAKFTLMPPEQTGVNFTNRFKEDYTYNILQYQYLYNGGGVATGDVNGDGLPDIYFSATFGPNILYLNLGDFKFLNVTIPAGVAAPVGFKTGVAMADINNDGRLDIYSCRTSKTDNGQKDDHVFINMGNRMENGIAVPFFEDQSVKLGLNDNSNSNHVCFLDYDRDGDLDIFLLNHKNDFSESAKLRLEPDATGKIIRSTTPTTPFESNKLYRNDNSKFTEVTQEAGLISSAFGLSATAADLNTDGWMDIYVANDYVEPDRVYINNKDGTFTDKYFEYLKHSCQNSMGSDIADINNDGLEDIIVLDMKPEDPIRYKMLINVMQYDRYNLLDQYGYGRQVGRNVLQLNNGNNTFSEIGQFAGVDATDWSWGAMIADFDNDGWKDTYIANGYRRDVTNYDYLTYVRDSINRTGGLTPKRFPDINMMLDLIPEKKILKYLYINNKKLGFTDVTKQAGMDQPAYSNGSAYADLDLDGDLDIIVNNILDPAFIYRNDISGAHWLQIDVQDTKNTDGIGAVAEVYTGNEKQHMMMIANKGFFSSSEPILHFGLGDHQQIDSIIFTWSDGSKEILTSVTIDRRIIWKRGTGKPYKKTKEGEKSKLFVKSPDLNWMHNENSFVDFKREKLIPYMISAEGPCISIGDVNGDNLEDIYAGNGSGFSSTIMIQNADQSFSPLLSPTFVIDTSFEDCGSVLEDFDKDGDKDLLVVSGGNAFPMNDQRYMTRYYINDGKGSFNKSLNFPLLRTNAGAVYSLDYDGDKDLDIIIAGRSSPGIYPTPPKSYLLKNENGKFSDVTTDVFPLLSNLGMITDVKSADLNGDQNIEVVIVGDWLPITVFSLKGNKFEDQTAAYGLEKSTGWWKSVSLADIDNDGDIDVLAGNMGMNHRLETSELYPVTLISNDFDKNGSIDPVLCFYHEGKLYPYAGRDAIISQVPALKKQFIRYSQYATATIEDIFTSAQLKAATKHTVNTFKTMLYINDNNRFVSQELPFQTQFAPVFDFIVEDVNGDNRKDILMAGNFLYSETETGEMDAGNGVLLLQNADKTFQFVPNTRHGFWAQDEVRELETIQLAKGGRAIITGNNKGPLQVHLISHSPAQLQ